MRVCLFDGYMRNRAQLCEELGIPPAGRQEQERSVLEAGFDRSCMPSMRL